MELTHGAWSGVAAARDASGRQLGEDNVTPSLLRCPVKTVWARWRGGGSRQNCLFNVSALRQVSSQWKSVLKISASARARLLGALGCPNRRLTAAELFVLSVVLTAWPAWSLRRSSQPLRDGELPEIMAGVYKAAAGIQFGVRHLLATGSLHRCESKSCLLDYVEEFNLLHTGTSGRVCSGPRKLMEDYAGVLLEGGPEDDGDLGNEAFEYGLLAARVELMTMLHCLDVARLAQAEFRELLDDYDPARGPWASLDERAEVLAAMLAVLAPGFEVPSRPSDLLACECEWWSRFQAVQTELDRGLGRAGAPVPYSSIRHRLVEIYRQAVANRSGLILVETDGKLKWAPRR